MNTITSPINRSESGAAVTNLQDALLFLLQNAPALLPGTERPALIAGLTKERLTQIYGDRSQFLVKYVIATAKMLDSKFLLVDDARDVITEALGVSVAP